MELERFEISVYFKQDIDFQPEKFRKVLKFCLKHMV